MNPLARPFWILIALAATRLCAADLLPGTQPLLRTGDFSAQMVAGIDSFLMREIEASATNRAMLWRRDFRSREAYEKSLQPHRERLRKAIGAVDARVPFLAPEFTAVGSTSTRVAETDRYSVFAVRWPVFEGVFAEGLLFEPNGKIAARIVALTDADQTPEQLAGLAIGISPAHQWIRRLAENGCQLLVPVLVDRQATWSGSDLVGRNTNQPHREWIYRQAFEMGRHIIGYEVQKVLAAVDWFSSENRQPEGTAAKIGIAGFAEGALLAHHAAALDPRVDATLVSGYFDSRQGVWAEPIYRNIFGQLREFADAEIASLITPRPLIIEQSVAPKIDGPPSPAPGRTGAAPGRWATPAFASAEAEVARARSFFSGQTNILPSLQFVHHLKTPFAAPMSDTTLAAFFTALGIKTPPAPITKTLPTDARKVFNPQQRQRRTVKELEEHTQRLMRLSARGREEFFWNRLKPASATNWHASTQSYRSHLWDEVIGRLPAATLPANPLSRKIHDTPKWTGYEVTLDVWPDVFAWGYLLLPKNLKPGERRPTIVCQHGLEGLPADVVTTDPKERAYDSYKGFAARLADEGYIVFAPHNPYRGQDSFRVLQRKANPLGKSLFAVILAQHDRILDWLSSQPFADPKRIAFYGLSYGGKTAMRVPALLDRYCLSICSADFNEWVDKNTTTSSRYSYMFTHEYEIYEFNLGHTFNYAEMAALIAPRPFMVERGHDDGVGIDEQVAYEYAKVRRLYARLGLPERTTIEFFNGPHTINGKESFDFLRRHLQ
jgi:dienelactone hydrolase